MGRKDTTLELSKRTEKYINPYNDPRIYWAKEVTFDYGSINFENSEKKSFFIFLFFKTAPQINKYDESLARVRNPYGCVLLQQHIRVPCAYRRCSERQVFAVQPSLLLHQAQEKLRRYLSEASRFFLVFSPALREPFLLS